jgi:hypothetical protein
MIGMFGNGSFRELSSGGNWPKEPPLSFSNSAELQAGNDDNDVRDIRSLHHLDKRDRTSPSFERAQSRR